MRCTVFILAAWFISGAAFAGTTAAAGDSLNKLNNEQGGVESGSNDKQRFYDEWDTNGDGRIDKKEFFAAYEAAGLFDKWDVNDDGVVDARELGDGMYASWDFDDETHIKDAGAPSYWFRE